MSDCRSCRGIGRIVWSYHQHLGAKHLVHVLQFCLRNRSVHTSDLVVTITTTVTKSNCSSFTLTITRPITKSKSNTKTTLKLNQNTENYIKTVTKTMLKLKRFSMLSC